jgi:hypothetical protein
MTLDANEAPKKGWRFLAWYELLVVTLVASILLLYGEPLDPWTFGVLVVGVVLSTTAFLLFRSRWTVVVPLLYFGSFLVPWESRYIADTRGGRHGVRVLPWDARFGRDGSNTALLTSYLGPLEPDWQHAAIRSMLFGMWRDGDERVHTRGLIFRPYLADALAMLPTNDARVQVLGCLTDPDNLLRVHHGLLLACLWEWGYPQGYNAEGWWRRHQHLFRREQDASAAARLAAGWTEQIRRNKDLGVAIYPQFRAARYQEQGSWGGDHDFGDAYAELGSGSKTGIPEVVWWTSLAR